MLDAALKYLAELAQKSAAPVKIDSGDVRELRYVANGLQVVIPTTATPRSHAAGDLSEIVSLANRFVPVKESDNYPVVWYDREKVVLVIDDDGHRLETATLTLQTSDVFATLRKLAASRTPMEQKQFMRLLRIDLAGTLDPGVLLNKVRKVDFTAISTVKASSSANRQESLGRTLLSEVKSDGGDIPEQVTLSVPVYKTHGEREAYPCRCSVEVDPGEGTFVLRPLPDEIERVEQFAVASIAGRLRAGLSEGVPFYHGKP